MALSHREIRNALQASLPNDAWIEDIYPDSVVYGGETGVLYRSSYSISESGMAALGSAETVRRKTEYEVVRAFAEFSGSGRVRTGKIFEIGHFPDKRFTLTEGEADQVVAAFRPVPILLSHTSTVLDQKAPGQLMRIWRQGRDIFGEVHLSDWLDGLFAKENIKVSCGWQLDPKALVELSLVNNPRISDAAIFAAMVGAEGHPAPETSMSNQEQLKAEEAGFLRKMFAFFHGEAKPDPVETRIQGLESKFDALMGKIDSFGKDPAATAPAEGQALIAGTQFADSVIAAKKALPGERQAIIDGYAQVANSAPKGHVLFSAGQINRTPAMAAFELAYNSRPVNALFQDAIPAKPDYSQFEADGSLPIDKQAIRRSIGGQVTK